MSHDVTIVLTALLWGGAGALGAWLLTWPLSRRSQPGALLSVCVVATAATVCAVIGNTRAMFLSMADEYVTVGVSVIAGLLASLTAIATARRFARDTATLQAAMGALGSGAAPVAEGRRLTGELELLRAELTSTGRILAESRDREQALESSRRQLMTWVSQDLRTPLAGLQAMAQALEDGAVEVPELYHKQIKIEVDRVVEMVDDLFEISRSHAGAATRSDRVDLDHLVSACVAAVEPVAAILGVRIVRHVVEPAPGSQEVLGNSVELNRALTNLLINAIRHCTAEAIVAVSVNTVQDDGVAAVAVSVRDRCGAGAAAPPLSERGSSGASALGAGVDPGLAITRGIITAHRGSVAVGSTGEGCEFTIRLPAFA